MANPEHNSYERLRRENLLQNKRILAELGLRPVGDETDNRVDKENGRNNYSVTSVRTFAARKTMTGTSLLLKRRKLYNVAAEGTKDDSTISEQFPLDYLNLRRSSRLIGKQVKYTSEDVFDLEIFGHRRREPRRPGQSTSAAGTHGRLDESTYAFQKCNKPLEKKYGAVDNVPVGTLFQSRMECCYAGIHGPTVAGIHPGPEGAYSVCLNGGYEDDVDFGDMFTYTGEGGRDLRGTKTTPKNLRTAPQSKDQILSKGNLALTRSLDSKQPVRVLRGYKLNNKFAPESGYRYDGLYTVERSWMANGLSGFKVFRFAFKRVLDQPDIVQVQQSSE